MEKKYIVTTTDKRGFLTVYRNIWACSSEEAEAQVADFTGIWNVTAKEDAD